MQNNDKEMYKKVCCTCKVFFCQLQGFWYFAQWQSREIQVNLRNPAKFTKTRKISWNSVEILLAVNLQNLCQNFVTETGNQHSETTRRRLCCKKLGTSHDVKGFAIGSFLECIVVERANDDLWTRQTISSLKITTKSAVFLPIAFQTSLPRNFPQNSPIFPQFCS